MNKFHYAFAHEGLRQIADSLIVLDEKGMSLGLVIELDFGTGVSTNMYGIGGTFRTKFAALKFEGDNAHTNRAIFTLAYPASEKYFEAAESGKVKQQMPPEK